MASPQHRDGAERNVLRSRYGRALCLHIVKAADSSPLCCSSRYSVVCVRLGLLAIPSRFVVLRACYVRRLLRQGRLGCVPNACSGRKMHPRLPSSCVGRRGLILVVAAPRAAGIVSVAPCFEVRTLSALLFVSLWLRSADFMSSSPCAVLRPVFWLVDAATCFLSAAHCFILCELT